jgi:hypothetical protein
MDRKRLEIEGVEKALKDNKLSRRGLLSQLKGLGIGLGAAAVLASKSNAHGAPEATVTLKSTNPALNAIIKEAPVAPAGEAAGTAAEAANAQQMAYFRAFRRIFRRF